MVGAVAKLELALPHYRDTAEYVSTYATQSTATKSIPPIQIIFAKLITSAALDLARVTKACVEPP
jgi:hypothetical protein